MIDSVKAAKHANFNTDKEKLITIVEGYRQRKYIEEMEIILNQLNGANGLLNALNTDIKQGISAQSLDARDSVFGSNAKDPPTRTGFCKMVLAALDDFMLKLLIVCAFVSIVVEVGFNINNPEKLKFAWIEGTAILLAVACVSLVSAWSDYKKEGQFMKQQMQEYAGKKVSYSLILFIFEFRLPY